MIVSMTGFGRAEGVTADKKIVVEIRSLNSKFLDLQMRVPSYYRDREFDLRKMISSRCRRGKIDFVVLINDSQEGVSVVDTGLLEAYYKSITDYCTQHGIPFGDDLLTGIVRLPDILQPENETLSNDEWTLVEQLTNQAIDALLSFRISEGNEIQTDIVKNLNSILELQTHIPQYEAERISTIKDRLSADLQELRQKYNVDIDANRYEQEVLFYMDKLDINEEKVRLKRHCDYFLETIDNEDDAGKKLGFIAQEIGREINTLGAKACHTGIQKIVVGMKNELEKIKEQILNVL